MPPKQTRLDDTAAIYQRRNKKTEKEKLSEMTLSEKWQYFKQYYLLKLIVTIASVAFVGYFLYTVFAPRPEQFLNVTFLDYYFPVEKSEQYQAELEDYFKIDKETQKITVDASYNLSGPDSYSYYQRIFTYIFAGEIDVIIAPESIFASYASQGNIMCITDFTTDVLSKILEKNSANELSLFKCKQVEEDANGVKTTVGNEEPYGIYLKDFAPLENYAKEDDPPVIGIVINTKKRDNATEYLRYALNLK